MCVSQVLIGEYIGLEEIDNGIWDVYYGQVWLGRLDERVMKIQDEKGNLHRQTRKEYLNKV
jgi:putative transposase